LKRAVQVPKEPYHVRHEIGIGRLDHEMKVVALEAEGMHLPVRLGAGFTKGFEEVAAVGIVLEDRFAAVTSVHDMMDRTGIFEAQGTRYGRVFVSP
jgi:hypothetical protein